MRTDCTVASELICKRCQKGISDDEAALHKKLFNRGATEFFCINCCSDYLEVEKGILEEKMAFFKKSGCTLFKENRKNL